MADFKAADIGFDELRVLSTEHSRRWCGSTMLTCAALDDRCRFRVWDGRGTMHAMVAHRRQMKIEWSLFFWKIPTGSDGSREGSRGASPSKIDVVKRGEDGGQDALAAVRHRRPRW